MMEYNTKREKMMFYGYGRNIHKMIEYAKNIQNRDERNIAARNIIKVMAMVNPSVRETVDYEHMLWDHLMMWSNFELDVDSPYPVERVASMRFKPDNMRHQTHKIRYRHYGTLLESMIKKAAAMPEGPERDCMVVLIANQMKKDYIDFNHDSAPVDVLNNQLRELSGGKLCFPEGIQLEDYSGDTMQKNMLGCSRKKSQSQKKKNKNRRVF